MTKTGRSMAPLIALPVVCALILVAVFSFDDGDDDSGPVSAGDGTGATARLTGFEAVLGKLPVPAGNPQSDAKIELGKLLFFDPRLSGNNQISCATCHAPDKGFSDGVARQIGPKGELGRNAPTIWNSAYVDFPFWDGRSSSLEDQAAGPMRAEVEMAASIPELLEELRAVPEYKERFKSVFGDDVVSFDNVAKAIAAFERTIVTANSAWDKFKAGDKGALTDEQRQGEQLFNSTRTNCGSCHVPPLFSDNRFHVLAVPQVGPKKEDVGRFEVTSDPADKGAFKTPTLRNVEFSGPYMHTGGLATLEDVVEFYNAGGGAVPGVVKSPLIKPLNLTAAEKKALVAYMKALSDTTLRVTPPKLPGLGAGAAPAKPQSQAGGKVTGKVALLGLKFVPQDVTVKPGEAVEWTWQEAVDHNVTGPGFTSKTQSAGTFTHTFAKAGTFKYNCTIHGEFMSGTIKVG